MRNEQNLLQDVLKKEEFQVYISEEEIRRRTKELGRQIAEDYLGHVPIFVGVLNGSFIFLADLIREVPIDCEIDFLKISSYGDEKISSGRVSLLKALDCEIEGRDLIVVEDIVDSGLSIQYMRKMIMAMKPRSLKFVTLLLKKRDNSIAAPIDYVGFEIPDKFVIGYGLDYKQKLRNLRAIYIEKESKLE